MHPPLRGLPGTSNTGNGYYGGLQMDWRFMQRYGPEFVARWGTADNWPVWAQLEAAARAHDSGRGFTPWPNTARACGLSVAFAQDCISGTADEARRWLRALLRRRPR